MASKSTMSPKTPVAKKTGTNAVLGPSPCLQRGSEFVAYVYTQASQQVDAFCQICGGPADLTISIHQASPTAPGGTPIFSGTLPPNPNPLTTSLPPVTPGEYIVMWQFAATGYWDIVAELQVAGVTRFRKINSNQGDKIPVNAIWCYLRVLP